MSVKRIGIITSGGDCPGLNAVIESVVRTASEKGYEVYGFMHGYDGLYKNDYKVLTVENTFNISKLGGSIICNSNKTNLFNFRYVDENGEVKYKDVSDVAVENLKKDGVDALVIVGGDGSMTSGRDFMRKGVNIVCVPKTIDNDVPYTDQTFGYSTACFQIAHALESVRTTGASHDRIMIVEVMGRHAGWLALEGGLSGNADMIILPEIPFNEENIAKKLIERYNKGLRSTVICVSEGAKPQGGDAVAVIDNRYPDAVKLGGIGAVLAPRLEALVRPVTGQEIRSTNLAYIQRGGDCNSFDRVLSFRYGSYAVEAIAKGDFGKMVSIRGNDIFMVPVTEIVGNGPTGETSKGGSKNVSENSDLLRTARSLGIYLGE